MVQQKRFRYSDVYTDSEEDQFDILAKPSGSRNEIKAGQFVLIELVSVKNKRQKYVGISQTCIDQDYNIKVMYMTTVSGQTNNEQLFKIENSKSYIVTFKEICGVLKYPEIKETGNQIFYEFEETIDL